MPQIGPGKGDGVDKHDDFGREQVTKSSADRYKFRTPSLRNVMLTGPWGHDGAPRRLEAVIGHHADPAQSLEVDSPRHALLPERHDLDAIDFVVHEHKPSRAALLSKSELNARSLSSEEIDSLIDFLAALIDPTTVDLQAEIPRRVPGGEPVDN